MSKKNGNKVEEKIPTAKELSKNVSHAEEINAARKANGRSL